MLHPLLRKVEPMNRFRVNVILVAAFLGVAVWTPTAQGRPMYNDGTGVGCVSCHNGFVGGNGALHVSHLNKFGIGANCNLCHPNGGGTTPVNTYTSGPGGGFGCAGCHGQDYGEISPTSGLPKASAYGLRQLHVSQGVTSCGTSSCHAPGSLGHPNPFPTVFGEDHLPPYYGQPTNNLTEPCLGTQEDMPFDVDTIGLDNDGDGLVDLLDPDCAGVTTTSTTTLPTTTTTTLPLACDAAPTVGCVLAGKGTVSVDEKKPGKEKIKLSLKNLVSLVTPAMFGDPATGSTSYKVCLYDGANSLKGTYTIDRAGDICNGVSCWQTVAGKGYKYGDKLLQADGVQKAQLYGGLAGKGMIKLGGNNKLITMPTGVAPTLQNQTSGTVQLRSSNASCFSLGLSVVKKADGLVFSAVGP